MGLDVRFPVGLGVNSLASFVGKDVEIGPKVGSPVSLGVGLEVGVD